MLPPKRSELEALCYPLTNRVYNPNALLAGAHHYTLDAAERDILVEVGWSDEGIAWYGMNEEEAKELMKKAS